ncbi:hypothetical protein [Synechococcus elongatus]|uniref:hypothetical protein n=1 Tax=Synechococcus elongatus TaxID=32046 RepID=UPI000A68A942|nr:hypothetical protein [Synechococcus elongatus]MBD2688413.1 hypothetical protein [Synechococcus elongatus FACHB-1061]WKW04367.1 hypothetical protein QY054_07135 [Synechococcus elongatus PCC 7942 = FACHB-805]
MVRVQWEAIFSSVRRIVSLPELGQAPCTEWLCDRPSSSARVTPCEKLAAPRSPPSE